jgi:PAS domain S-box-containing protein
MGKISTRIAIAATVLLLLVGGVVVALRGAVSDLTDAGDVARSSQEVLTTSGDLYRLAVDAETGMRGFVITGNPAFLEPYTRARGRIGPLSRELSRLVANDPDQARRVRGLNRALDAYLSEYAGRVVRVARRDRAQARAIVAGGGGKRRVDAIRARFSTLRTEERDLAGRRHADAEASGRRAAVIGVGGIALAIGLVVLFTAIMGRSVVRPVRRVAGAAGRLAGGDLSARVPDEGTGEISDLGDAFNEMAAALERTVGELDAERESAREQADLTAAVLETAHDAFVSMDSEGKIIAWNSQAERMFGWPASLAMGRDLANTIIPAGLRAAHREGLQRFVTTGEGRVLNRRLHLSAMHREGTEFPVEMTISPLRQGSGYRFNTFIADGSQSAKARRLRDAQNAVLLVLAEAATLTEALDGVLEALGTELGWEEAAFWSSVDGVLRCERVWHADEVGLDAFAQVTRTTDVAPGEGLPGRVWASRAPVWVLNCQREDMPRRAAAARARLHTAVCVPVLSEGEPVGALELFGMETRRRDDEMLTALSGLASQIGQFVERKRAEQESDRLKREFFALVSHELRTPLTSILGYLEILQEDDELNDEAKHFLGVIDRNADRLLRLVGDLLFVAQVQAGKFDMKAGPVELDGIVADALEAATPHAVERSVRLHGCRPPIGVLQGDRVRLAQLLDNLVSNALKFTPPGGEVEVTLAREGTDAVLTVRDTGMGIPDAEQARLFERFFRTSQATEAAITGAGLGLTITKAIVDGHGGHIDVSSTEGVGTTFRVVLPGLQDAPDGAAALPAPQAAQ